MADSGYTIHTVGPADTIQAIGDVYGVDWTEIATVNGLAYPYINTEPESGDNHVPDNVAGIGRHLLIPTSGLLFPVRSDNGVLDVEKYLLGADLDIYSVIESENHVVPIGETGELAGGPSGDLLVASGIRNLRQQLVTRLGTPVGTLLLHPEWGSDLLRYIGQTITQELLIKEKVCVQECLLKDARVAAISGLTVHSDKTVIFIDCVIHAIQPFGSFRLQAEISETGATLAGA